MNYPNLCKLLNVNTMRKFKTLVIKKSLHEQNSRENIYMCCEKKDTGDEAKHKICLTYPKINLFRYGNERLF